MVDAKSTIPVVTRTVEPSARSREVVVRQPARSSIPALLLLVCVFAGAEPARAATQTAQVQANVVKPLVLAMLQSLDLGTITLGPGTWSNATVSLSKAG